MSDQQFSFHSWAKKVLMSDECIEELNEQKLDSTLDLLEINENDMKEMELKIGDRKRLARAVEQRRFPQRKRIHSVSSEEPGTPKVRFSRPTSPVEWAKVGCRKLNMYDFDSLDEKQQEEMKKIAKEKDFSEIIAYPQSIFEERESASIRIAIIGKTGSGKSTLVNTLRGIRSGDDGAALTGITETTEKTTEYQHPQYENIVFVDMPGVATSSFNSENYFQRMKIISFDVIVVVYDNRFTLEETQLVKNLVDEKRSFVFVRSKFDIDVDQEKKRNAKVTVQEIRTNLKREISNQFTKISKDLHRVPVFFINGENATQYEFPGLEYTLFTRMPEQKKCALLRSLRTTSVKLLEEKKEYLLGRINLRAGLATVGSLQPVPGIGLLINDAAIQNALSHYKDIFNLTPNGLERLSLETGLEYSVLEGIALKHIGNIDDDPFKLVKWMNELKRDFSLVFGIEYFDVTLPVVGFISAAPVNFILIRKFLRHIVEDYFYPCAKEIQGLVLPSRS